jgi:HEAT repeat protein
LHALGSLGPKAHAAIPAMTALLEDPIGSVRASAAAALGMLGPAAREAAAPLEHLLDDEDEGVRRQAKWALRQIAGEGESRP